MAEVSNRRGGVISGNEDASRLSEQEQALSRFYLAFNGRDLALAADSWEQSRDAVMDNPIGGISRGWAAIEKVYDRLFTSDFRVTVEFWDYSVVELTDGFIAIGRERGRFTGPEVRLDLAIRTSRIFRRDATGTFRQVHHHGSIEDPQLLAAYRQAVGVG